MLPKSYVDNVDNVDNGFFLMALLCTRAQSDNLLPYR
jgi:hypothetical protein